jgi:hypothetical protein
VLVLRFGNLWYNASIAALNELDGTYGVLYEDEDQEIGVDAARIMEFSGYAFSLWFMGAHLANTSLACRYEFEVDDPVEVRRHGIKYYKGVVESKNLGRPGTAPTYDIRWEHRIRIAFNTICNSNFSPHFSYIDSDDLELNVDVSLIRVSTGFMFNDKALRKIVPNKPRAMNSGGGNRADDPINKEVINVELRNLWGFHSSFPIFSAFRFCQSSSSSLV